jgi:hypothetical protein
MVEVCLKSPPPLPDKYEALRKSSAFSTKNALDKYLRKAPPTIARELISRLKRGQIAFPPDQLKVADDGVYLVLKTRSVKIPGLAILPKTHRQRQPRRHGVADDFYDNAPSAMILPSFASTSQVAEALATVKWFNAEKVLAS